MLEQRILMKIMKAMRALQGLNTCQDPWSSHRPVVVNHGQHNANTMFTTSYHPWLAGIPTIPRGAEAPERRQKGAP